MKIITGEYSAIEYTILLDDQPIYDAGNSLHDSYVRVPGARGIGLAKMREYCIQTAKELAQEHGAEYRGVERAKGIPG